MDELMKKTNEQMTLSKGGIQKCGSLHVISGCVSILWSTVVYLSCETIIH
jgi:hypothetical protein